MRYTTLHARKKYLWITIRKQIKTKLKNGLIFLTRVLISCSARVTLIKTNIKENQKI